MTDMPRDIDECYQELGAAIVKQAVDEYKQALINDNKLKIAENEHFFRSGWYKILTNIDGKMLVKRLRSTVMQFRDEANLAFDENRISGKKGNSFLPDSQAFQCPVCGGNVYVVYKRLKFIIRADPERNGDLYKIGECIGYRATCFSCGLHMNRIEKTRMFTEPVYHAHPQKGVLIGLKGNQFAVKKRRRRSG